jgi:hypothetical protein
MQLNHAITIEDPLRPANRLAGLGAVPLGVIQTDQHALANRLHLELSQRGKHRQGELAHARGRVKSLAVRHQIDAQGAQLFDDLEEMRRRAASEVV